MANFMYVCGGRQLPLLSLMLPAVSGRVFFLAMFTVFSHNFIINLRVLSVGCSVNGNDIGCLMYADDLILLS